MNSIKVHNWYGHFDEARVMVLIIVNDNLVLSPPSTRDCWKDLNPCSMTWSAIVRFLLHSQTFLKNTSRNLNLNQNPPMTQNQLPKTATRSIEANLTSPSNRIPHNMDPENHHLLVESHLPPPLYQGQTVNWPEGPNPPNQINPGWWLGTFYIFPYIGNVIIPIDELIFFRGETTNQLLSTINHYKSPFITINHHKSPLVFTINHYKSEPNPPKNWGASWIRAQALGEQHRLGAASESAWGGATRHLAAWRGNGEQKATADVEKNTSNKKPTVEGMVVLCCFGLLADF